MSFERKELDGIFLENRGLDEKLILVLILDGYLDTMNSNGVSSYFQEVISKEKGLKYLILDLTKLSYASSSGIGAFTALLMNCKRLSIELELHHVNPKIKDVIDLLGFTSFFSIKE